MECGIIMGMDTQTLLQIVGILVSAVAAAGSLMAGIGALWAVRQIRRHWSDDEPKLSCTYLDESRSLGEIKQEIWTATVRVTNIGKVSVSVCGFDYFGSRLIDRRSEVRLDESFSPVLVVPGQTVDVTARCENVYSDRPPVFIDGVKVRTASGGLYDVTRPAGFTVDVFGRKERYDSYYSY